MTRCAAGIAAENEGFAGREMCCVMSGDQNPGTKNPLFSGFSERFAKPVNSMGFFRARQSGFAQALGVVITRCRVRNGPGLGDAAGILGMGQA
jgi:hypothetical protein